jgi:hypothetical protein
MLEGYILIGHGRLLPYPCLFNIHGYLLTSQDDITTDKAVALSAGLPCTERKRFDDIITIQR